MTKRPFGLLLLALAALLVVGAYIAVLETIPTERSFELSAIACPPVEPPLSRLGCSQ